MQLILEVHWLTKGISLGLQKTLYIIMYLQLQSQFNDGASEVT